MTRQSPIPIEEISDKFDGSVTMLYYAESGAGKTELAGSIGKDGIILEIGAGDLTLRSPGFRSRYKDIPKIAFIHENIDPATGLFRSADAFNQVTDFCDWFLEGQNDFQTLAIDDATSLNIFARNLGMEANAKLDIGDTMRKSQKVGFPVPEVSDYGKEINILMWFLGNDVAHFKRRKKNLLITAHERHIYKAPEKVGGEPTITKIIPGFTGKTLPDTIEQFFDFVWRGEVANGTVFRCKTISNQNYKCKTRWSGVFPEEIKNPDFSKVVAVMQSGKRYRMLDMAAMDDSRKTIPITGV